MFGKLVRQFRKATTVYHLLEDGDHIMVGLSGGKDSLLLLELLGQQARIFKPSIRVEACHIRMENIRYETNTDYIERFCSRWNIPLHIITTRFDDTTDTNKPKCFLCSWYRRKALFKIAQEKGCNKIALGHHQDDIINTCLMNLFYQGRFESTPPLYKMAKMPLEIIRPLCLMKEEDIRKYAEMAEYEKQAKLCPYEKSSQRSVMDDVFKQIEAITPEARYSVWKALMEKQK